MVYHGGVQSVLGANVHSCSLLGISFSGQTIDDIHKRRLTSEHYGRAMIIVELLMIKSGVLDVSECHYSCHDITSWLILFLLRNYVTLNFFVFFCHL